MMVRPKKQRNIEVKPSVCIFIPKKEGLEKFTEVLINLDELEALRLTNIEELSQEKTAVNMGVSRQLVGLMLSSARKKITEALLNGSAIRLNIED